MNTADRSIALIDTALRRRFDFVEMMPEAEVVDFSVNGIEIKLLLKTINQRIEYLYDRDHTIGHSYFIKLKDMDEKTSFQELQNIFRNKIIPLLQEYFYEDWEKIQIVLGDYYSQFGNIREAKNIDDNINKHRFIIREEMLEKNVIGFDHEEIENEKVKYVINDNFTKEAFQKIYYKGIYDNIRQTTDHKAGG